MRKTLSGLLLLVCVSTVSATEFDLALSKMGDRAAECALERYRLSGMEITDELRELTEGLGDKLIDDYKWIYQIRTGKFPELKTIALACTESKAAQSCKQLLYYPEHPPACVEYEAKYESLNW